MVSIFTGAGTGFERGSGNVLGGAGLLGSGAMGRAGEQVSLNAANGNLLISRQDEYLVGRGPDAAITRTYNSLGDLSDDNGDNWRQSTQRQVRDLTGSVNTWGSTVKRVSGDGSIITYAYDGAGYVATDGTGAHDRLRYDGTWRWTDGDSGAVEVYGGPNGQITLLTDASGNSLRYDYSGDKLSDVWTANGERIHYGWSGNNLTEINTVYHDGGNWRQLTRVRYGYDGYNRLANVAVDLSPDDNNTSDGNRYVTSYTYHGVSKLVASITQTDGSRLDVRYDDHNRVASLTQTVADGVSRTTTIAYGGSFTLVTDPQGQTTTLWWSDVGQLTQITAPPAIDGSPQQLTNFNYDAAGNLTDVRNAAGTTRFAYDARGNTVRVEDPAGGVTERTFDGANRMLTETVWGSDAQGDHSAHTRRLAYDSVGNLRFAVDQEGGVTEYGYDGYGQQIATYRFAGVRYDTTGWPAGQPLDLGAIIAWRQAIDKSSMQIGETLLDARGNVKDELAHGATRPDGSVQPLEGYAHRFFIRDQAGQLLSRFDMGRNPETFAYDGLGRVVASTDAAGATTRIVFQDGAQRTVVTLASGLVETSTYNRAGELVAKTKSVTENLVPNSELANGTDGWDLYNAERIAGPGGDLPFVFRQAMSAPDGYSKTPMLSAPSASSVTLSFQAKPGAARQQFQASIMWYDQAGNFVKQDYYNEFPADTSQFGAYTYDVAKPAGATQYYAYVIGVGGARGQWGGLRISPTNMIPNARLATGTDGWRLYNAERIVGPGGDLPFVFRQASSAPDGYSATEMLSALSVSSVTLSFKIKPGAAHQQFQASIMWYDQAGNFVKQDYRDVFPTDTSKFHAYTYDVAKPAGATQFYAYVIGVGGAQGQWGGLEVKATPARAESAPVAIDLYSHDSLGRLRGATDATGRSISYVYDRLDRKIAEVDREGRMTEYRYDAADRLVATVRYTHLMAGWQRDAAIDPGQSPQIADLRPPAHAQDIWLWNVHDADGRLIQTIGGDGSATIFEYDASDRLVRTTAYANKLEGWRIESYKGSSPAALQAPTASAADSVERRFYDRAGRATGTLDGEGRLSRTGWDAIGMKVEEVHYGNPVPEHLRAQGSFAQLVSSVGSHPADATSRWVYDNQGHLRYEIDALNRVAEYGYEHAGGKWSAFGPLRQTVRYAGSIAVLGSYTIEGMRQAIADAGLAGHADNRISQAIYDGAGRPIYAIDPEGAVTGYRYDAMGNVARKIEYADRRGIGVLPDAAAMNAWQDGVVGNQATRITRNYYSGSNQLRLVIDAEGYVTRNDYDAEGRLTFTARWNDPVAANDGWTVDTVAARVGGEWVGTTYGYDIAGRLSRVTDGNGVTNEYSYWANGTLAWEITASGTAEESRVHHIYDAAGREVVRYDAMGSADQTATHYAYDGRGNLVSTTDAGGRTTTNGYDRAGQLVTVTDALGGATSYGYDALGNRIRETDARGATTWSYYDKAGRVIAVRDAENYVTDTSHTVFGEIATITRRANQSYTGQGLEWPHVHVHDADATTRFAYDKLGRVTVTQDAEGYAEHRWYDAFGNVVQEQNKAGGVIRRVFDRRGQVIAETLPMASSHADGTVIANEVTNRFEYDARGNLTRRVEASGLLEQRTTRFAYDNADRLVETRGDAVRWVDQGVYHVQAPTEPVERRRYDARGNLVELIDPRGARTLFYYDKLDRMTEQVDALANIVSWRYDAVGNLTHERRWALKTPYAVVGAHHHPASTAEDRVTDYTYDRLNRMTSSIVRGVRTGRWTGSAYSTGVNDVTTTYDYDASGNVLRVIDGAGNAVHTIYDRLGRRMRQVDAEGFVTGWHYDAEGNVHQERRWATRSPGYGVGWSSDPATSGEDRVTDITHDRMGRRRTETRRGVVAYAADGNGTLYGVSSDATVSYQYNGLGQVTRRAEATGEATSYEYDAAGRLAHETRAGYHDQDGVWTQPLVTYRYNGLGDLARTEQTRQGGGEARVVRYGYSAGGRLHTMTDTTGTVFTYWQDIAGAEVLQTWNRNRSDGSVQHEGVMYTRDALGRVQSQATGWHTGIWYKGDVQETRYNVFGEVSQRGINGLQEEFGYDQLGNLARTNSGDGVWRYFVADAAGRRTLTLENQQRDDLAGTSVEQALHVASNGSQSPIDHAHIDGVAATIAVYDRRGQQVATRLPSRELAAGQVQSLELAAGYSAFGELAWERDAAGATTHYAYNTMGRRTLVQRAAVSITDEAGNTHIVTPAERFYYDAGGRLVGQDDANNRRTTRHLLAGTGYGSSEALVTAAFHADGGVARFAYDRLGDQRRATDEIGRVTTMSYDAAGRLTQQIRPSGQWDQYGYDVLGQRLWHATAQLGEGERATSDYDHQGRVVSTRAFGGAVTNTSYSWIGGLATGGMGTYGGWQQVTTHANGYEQVEQSDVFGHVLYSHDRMAGTSYATTIGYDRGGRTTGRAGSDGETVTYGWYNTGLMATQSSDLGSGYARAVSRYGYDAAGRKTSESFARDGVQYTQATASYDALGRMTHWSQADTALPWATMAWAYDAVGNIRRTVADKAGLDPHGTAAYRSSEERWFRYDALNRVTLDGGMLAAPSTGSGQATVVRGGTGTSLTYDAAGQRVSATRDAVLTGTVHVYDPHAGGGGYHHDYNDIDQGGGAWVQRDVSYHGEREERFGYAADGQLASVAIAETGYTDDGQGNAVATGTLDRHGGSALFQYDGLGRRTRQLDRNAAGEVAWDHEQQYDAAGRVQYEVTRRLEAGATLTAETWNDYGGNAALGQVVAATTYSYRNGQHQGTTSYQHAYHWRGGGAQLASTVTAGQTASTTSYGYGAGGRLESIAISDGRPRTVSIVSDLAGQALTRDESDGTYGQGDPSTGSGEAPHERWYRFDGNALGHVGNDGTWASDYAGSIRTRGYVQQSGALGNNRRYTGTFAKSIDPITSYEQGAGGGGYTVRAGDTLAGIAAQVWGDASLWYKLAQANGLGGDSALTPGTTLTIPAGVIRSTHHAGQLNPYDPSDAIGDVSPVSAQPTARRKSNKCGAFGQILLTVVAVAVTALTGNPILANLASQGVGLATGIQQKFSFKSVALTALTAGVTQGLEGLSPLGTGAGAFANDVARGALANGLTQGVGVATGLQSKFDFAGLAAAGVISGVGGAVGRALPGRIGEAIKGGNGAIRKTPTFANTVLSGTASSLAGAAARSLATGTSFGDNIIAVLPDVIGATLGRAFAGAIGGDGPPRRGGLLGAINGLLNAPVTAIAGATGALVTRPIVRFQQAAAARAASRAEAASRATTARMDAFLPYDGANPNARSFFTDGADGTGELTIIANARSRAVASGSALSMAFGFVPILPSLYGWDRMNLLSTPYRGDDQPAQQYMMGNGSIVSGTPRQIDQINRQNAVQAQGLYLDRLRSSPIAGISLGLANRAGASQTTQDLVYGLASSMDGMVLAGASLAGARVPGMGNQGALTIVNGENGIHGNSRLSGRTTYLYELQTKTGEFLKYGISVNPANRYSRSFMADKLIRPIASGTRADMITLEREMISANPGPLNREPWAPRAKGGK